MTSEPAQSIAGKAASFATYGGSGGAVVSGLAGDTVLGLTTSQWSVVGVIGGLFIGLLGFLATIYFERRRTLAIERKADEGKA